MFILFGYVLVALIGRRGNFAGPELSFTAPNKMFKLFLERQCYQHGNDSQILPPTRA